MTAAVALAPCFGFTLLQTLQGQTALYDLLLALEQVQRLGVFVSTADGQEASFALAQELVRQTLLATI